MGRLNKPAQEGYRYRSPNQTNARDLTPNLREDVVASQRADTERMRKGLNPTAEREYNRLMQQEAGGRSLLRTAGRANTAALAGELGYALGRKLDEETGVGKKIVDKSGLGDVVDRVVNSRDKVKLSKEAQKRVDEGETKSEDTDTGTYEPRRTEGDFGAMKRGGKVKKMASGGMTSKVSSASKRADGCAVKGKTKGRYI